MSYQQTRNGHNYYQESEEEEEYYDDNENFHFSEAQFKQLEEIFNLFKNSNNEVCAAEILEGFDYLKLHHKYPQLRQFLANLSQKHGYNALDLEIFMDEFAEEAGHRNSEYGIRVRLFDFKMNIFFFGLGCLIEFRNCLLISRIGTTGILGRRTFTNTPRKSGAI
jgi:FMN phosphatase YigB (HAD superfamily)